jgi:hypothetical protein
MQKCLARRHSIEDRLGHDWTEDEAVIERKAKKRVQSVEGRRRDIEGKVKKRRYRSDPRKFKGVWVSKIDQI